MKKMIIALALGLSLPLASGASVAERFGDKTKLSYQVYFNGMYSGTVDWLYLGKQTVRGQAADALQLDSDTKILSFLDLTSHERIFLDTVSHLPVKVERDVLFFGRKELIEEFYNQQQGYVEVIKAVKGNKRQAQVLRQDKPIHHIMALLYFFPADIELRPGKVMHFNLPTRKLEIKAVGPRTLTINKRPQEVYLLAGSGGRRFNLWLDKEQKTPLRLDFFFPVGKVSIIKKD
jgi:hypothetical protein